MQQRTFEDIRNIYEHLGNSISKEIFVNRLLYNFLEEEKYIRKIIGVSNEGKVFIEQLQNAKRKVIWGAGIWGKEIRETYSSVKFECFVDNNKKETTYCGLPVIEFKEYLEKYSDATVIISTRLYYKEIYEQLIVNGIKAENILNAGKMIDDMSKKQYFDLPELEELKNRDNISFVDAGSFDGRTAVLFNKWRGEKKGKIWAFEPDSKNIQKCFEELKRADISNFEIINKGLWDKEDKLFFTAKSNGNSQISKDGTDVIYVERLEHLVHDRSSPARPRPRRRRR